MVDVVELKYRDAKDAKKRRGAKDKEDKRGVKQISRKGAKG